MGRFGTSDEQQKEVLATTDTDIDIDTGPIRITVAEHSQRQSLSGLLQSPHAVLVAVVKA